MKPEKDRENTEQRLIEAIGELIEEKGFEKVGVNAVAERAGVSKVLIYRYFNSLDGLIYEYIKRNDFWINVPKELPSARGLKEYLKNIFRQEIIQLRKNATLKRLHRWELSSNNPIVKELRAKREANGFQIVQLVGQMTKIPQKEVAAIASIIDAAIKYLVLLEENCHVYNGINIQSDEGWEQITQGIDTLIELVY